MNRVVAFTLFVVLLLLGVVGAAWFFTKGSDERARYETSDAGELQSFRLAGDGYSGYFFWRSPEMKRQAPPAGYAINFTDDGGAYAELVAKFAAGEYDAIVLPVAEYLLHGKDHNFPGVIVSAISDSKGVDGIAGFSQAFPQCELA